MAQAKAIPGRGQSFHGWRDNSPSNCRPGSLAGERSGAPADATEEDRSATKDFSLREGFRQFAEWTANAVGTYWAFLVAIATVAIWAVTGPLFGFSDTWQLFINTGTTIVTFLMVFLIQNTQNRASRIVGLKLDELLRALDGARTGLVALDHMSDRELEQVQAEFSRLPELYAPLIRDDIAHVERELNKRKEQRPK